MFALARKHNNPIGIQEVENCIEIEGSLPNGILKHRLLCFQYPQFENGMYKYRLKEMPEEFFCNHEVISEVMRTLTEKVNVDYVINSVSTIIHKIPTNQTNPTLQINLKPIL